jgi:predicted lysophospholipase L1 biosynthesis ABC-type transport system permease subunit
MAGALASGPLLESLLTGPAGGPADRSPSWPAIFALVTLAASWVPARRAFRVDPVQVLRQG